MEGTVQLAAFVAALFVLLFALERLFPLRKRNYELLGRLIVNGAVTGLAFLTAAALVRPAVEATLRGNNDGPFGLVHLIDLPLPVQGILAFLLMDLAFYWWHLANHKVPFLWRFHNVHHIDPELDVSTGFRFHFGEVALSAVFRVVQISVIGVSVWMFAAYELVFQANTLFHHSNVRLPIGVERVLNRILVTPRMHGIHHSQICRETNSNFSVVLPWWDWLHRTLRLNVPQSQVTIGIPGYTQSGDNTLRRVLMMPFQKQRDYWRRPDGTLPERDPSEIGKKGTRLEA